MNWWLGLHWKARMAVALAILLVSSIMLLAGRFWPWGFGVGVVLLIFSFPNDAEKRGYHDF